MPMALRPFASPTSIGSRYGAQALAEGLWPGFGSGAEGAAAVSAHYLLSQSDGQVQVTLDQAKATLDGLKLRLTDASEPFLALERIEAKDGRLDLRQRSIAIGALLVSGGSVQAVRRADGSVDLMRLATAAPAS